MELLNFDDLIISLGDKIPSYQEANVVELPLTISTRTGEKTFNTRPNILRLRSPSPSSGEIFILLIIFIFDLSDLGFNDMFILYLQNEISGTAAIVLLVLAGIFIVTSFMSFCPLYLPFGISTKNAKK
jgi:hypothetical protein